MCHALIIEDGWIIAMYLEQLARDAGAESIEIVDTEKNAIQAAFDKLPEIILSDVNLRFGTGPSAVDTIREKWGRIPVIFITDNPFECPCHDKTIEILTKPISPKSLVDTIRRLMLIQQAVNSA